LPGFPCRLFSFSIPQDTNSKALSLPTMFKSPHTFDYVQKPCEK